MSPSPPRPRREPRRLNSGAGPQSAGGLEIRIVPYSPPRISSATSNSASVSSRPMSYNDSVLAPLVTPSLSQAYPVGQDIDEHGPPSWIKQDVSPSPSSRLTNAASLHSPDSDNISVSTSRASSPRPSSSSRPKRIISVNSGTKTFSLLPLSGSLASRSESLGSTQPSSTTPSSSWGRVSSNAFIIEDRASSPLTPLSERRSFTSSYSEKTPPPESSRFPSWDRRMPGGMRAVEKTPDPHPDAPGETSEAPDHGWSSPLDALPEVSSDVDSQHELPIHNLLPKESFQSSQSTSTLSERTNYKVYGQSSPVIAPFSQQEISDVEESSVPPSLPPSSSDSNYQILAASSSDIQSLRDYRPQTGDSDANYVIHGGPSASNSSLVTSQSQLRSEYSRESLVVAPLRPVKQRSFERPTAFKSKSRESLRRGSLSSLSSTLSQEATRALFTGSFNVYTQGGARKQQLWGMSANSISMMGSHPHQWGAPLSTVMSESEGGSAPPSRSLSAFSGGDRRGSANSRHVLSISSSLLGLDAHAAASLCRTTSLEPPLAVLGPSSPRDLSGSMPQIRDHDEYGDGLADLDAAHQRPPRTRLASFMSNSSDRILRSSGSTGSLNMFSFPGWARLYYGSGERRFLIAQPSSDSIRSLYNGSMYNEHAPLPPVAQHSGRLNRSPSGERFTSSIRNPRRRARDLALPTSHAGPSTESEQLDVAPDTIQPPSRVMSIARRVRKRTSSVWSPHLRQDKRASGYSIWEPPSAPWTTVNGFEWKRNRQIVLFVVGFLIPFAWMIAAFLPLPAKPVLAMIEQQHNYSTSHLNSGSEPRFQSLDEAQYNSARWWRNLNRVMSIVGLFVIGAIIALVVVGVKQQWAS